MSQLHSFWEKRLTPVGKRYWSKHRWEIIDIYHKIGLYYCSRLSDILKPNDIFLVPNTKHGRLNEQIYKVLGNGQIEKCKCFEKDKQIIQISESFQDGVLFEYNGIYIYILNTALFRCIYIDELRWIVRDNNQDVITISVLFNEIGVNEIKNTVAAFKQWISHPDKFPSSYKKQFYCIPMNKIVWS